MIAWAALFLALPVSYSFSFSFFIVAMFFPSCCFALSSLCCPLLSCTTQLSAAISAGEAWLSSLNEACVRLSVA